MSFVIYRVSRTIFRELIEWIKLNRKVLYYFAIFPIIRELLVTKNRRIRPASCGIQAIRLFFIINNSITVANPAKRLQTFFIQFNSFCRLGGTPCIYDKVYFVLYLIFWKYFKDFSKLN